MQQAAKDKASSAYQSDDDFLSQHLGSLLVRQPEPSSYVMTASTSTISQASSSTSSVRRQSRDQASISRDCRRSSNHSDDHSPQSSRVNTLTEVSDSSATPRSPLNGAISLKTPQTPIDGVFSALFANAPLQTPSLSMINVKEAASDRPSDSSTSPEYFDRLRNNKNYQVAKSAGSGTFTTSFGRKRPSQKRTQSGSTCSVQSIEQRDSMGTLDSSQFGNRKSSIDRRRSDVTHSSGQSTVDTGITTPASFSDGYCEGLKTWPESDLTDVEEEYKPKLQNEPLSTLQTYELGDQTKWTRFQEGDAIEPPEAQSQAQESDTMAWARENAVKHAKAAESRYTSMTTSRFTFSHRETIKANSRLSVAEGHTQAIALVPFGEDGRSFRFITAGDQS